MDETIQLIRLITDTGMLILIWLVQLIIYPSFHSIEEDRFITWHKKYVGAIGCFVIPMMLLQLGAGIWSYLQFKDGLSMLYLASLAGAWGVTFTLSAPTHGKLQRAGRDTRLISQLVRTNWLRTLCWSMAWLTGLPSA